MVGDDTDLIVLLLHNTKDMELNKLFFRTKKWHWDIAIFAACIRKKPFMRHIISFYSESGCNTTSRIIMKDKKSSSESLKLTVSLFEDSNVPKADVICSVIAAKTIPQGCRKRGGGAGGPCPP